MKLHARKYMATVLVAGMFLFGVTGCSSSKHSETTPPSYDSNTDNTGLASTDTANKITEINGMTIGSSTDFDHKLQQATYTDQYNAILELFEAASFKAVNKEENDKQSEFERISSVEEDVDTYNDAREAVTSILGANHAFTKFAFPSSNINILDRLNTYYAKCSFPNPTASTYFINNEEITYTIEVPYSCSYKEDTLQEYGSRIHDASISFPMRFVFHFPVGSAKLSKVDWELIDAAGSVDGEAGTEDTDD